MSLLNQPSRLLISGDDSEWSNDQNLGGQTINVTLPEPVVGAQGVDCARCVIPNTQYPIPTYQNTFYYTLNGVQDSIVLSNNQTFTSLTELVTQLNADATAQSKPVVFSYNNNTNRISATIGTTTEYVVIVLGNNNNLPVSKLVSGTITTAIGVISPGIYTLTQFTAVANNAIFTACLELLGAGTNGNCTIDPITKICTFNVQANGGPNVYVDFTNNGQYSAQRTQALQLLYGFTTPIAVLNPTISGTNPMNFRPLSVSASPQSSWPTKFALNTRLGFPNVGVTGLAGSAITGTFMPNLIRSKVIYLLSNISVNDSITTDGLRNVF